MAKRGETRPWKVLYVWELGIHGTIACTSEDEADMKAGEIRAAGVARQLDVTVKVEHRP